MSKQTGRTACTPCTSYSTAVQEHQAEALLLPLGKLIALAAIACNSSPEPESRSALSAAASQIIRKQTHPDASAGLARWPWIAACMQLRQKI